MTDTPCTASSPAPTPSAPSQFHTCESLAAHGSSPHRCSCGTIWTATAMIERDHEYYERRLPTAHEAEAAEEDELDDEPSTVESVREWLNDSSEVLSGLIDDLHVLKRTVPEEHRESIMVAANGVGQAWAQARIALSALTDVTA